MKEKFIGQTVKQNYELKQLIGEGNFGSVYMASDRQDNSLVAIKLFDPRKNDSIDVEKEARTQARLHHPNIVPFHWYDIQNLKINELPTEDLSSHRGKPRSIPQDYPFIVMDYVNNGSLRDRLHDITTENAVDYLIQAATGLQYAHDKKVVHRDLKPENLLLHQHPDNDHLDLLISDFGIAVKAHTGEYDFTEQFPKGTAPYTAPEQIQGKAIKTSDIYSLGIIGFELLTGRRPFNSDQAVDILISHVSTPPPTFEEVRGKKMTKVLEELEEVIMKTLEKRPEDRHQSAGDFGQNLKDTYEHAAGKRLKNSRIINLKTENQKLSEKEKLLQKRWEEVLRRDQAVESKLAQITSSRQKIIESEISIAEEIAIKERVWDYRDNKQILLEKATDILGEKTNSLAITSTNDGKIYYSKNGQRSSFFDSPLTKRILEVKDNPDQLESICSNAQFNHDNIHVLIEDELAFIYTKYNTSHSHGKIGILGPLDYESNIPTLRFFGELIKEMPKKW